MSKIVRASVQYVGVICKFWYLPSNDVIAKIALRDHEILKVKKLKILYL